MEQETYNFTDSVGEQGQSIEGTSQQQVGNDSTGNIKEGQHKYDERTPETHSTVQTTPYSTLLLNKAPNIPNDDAPFVVLVGPPQSGKSMVLKCLGDYLYKHEELHYTIKADTTLFADTEYLLKCQIFDSLIGNTNQAMPNTVDYLMANISDKGGNVKAHFLEAPGEHFFSTAHPEEEPNRRFPNYIDKIAKIDSGSNRTNRKVVYIIILDLDSPTSFRRNPELSRKYQDKMVRLYNQFVVNHPAEVILLYNKVDIPQGGKWANTGGVNNSKAIIKNARSLYPQLFFTRKFLWWDIENFTFLPFCTGSYDGIDYTAPAASYPAALWKAITKIW